MSAVEMGYLERDADASLSFVVRFERHTARGGRFYALRIVREHQADLFGPRELGFVVLVTRGAIRDGVDRRVTSREEPFATLARAAERWGELCARRRRRGYEEQEQHA